jgi:hypothetical protein
MSRLNLRIDTLAMQTIWCVLLLVVSASGANLTVKSGGGGNYTTIQACATAMAFGDTCTVYAGTYNENVTVPSGAWSSGYKTLTVNGSDVVNVLSFVLNSHTKINGFHIQNPSNPNGKECVWINQTSTDVFVEQNVITECGHNIAVTVDTNNPYAGADHVYIRNNTISYGCGTPASPNNCPAIAVAGSYSVVEGNDVSHHLFCAELYGNHIVARNNNCHDSYETENGPSSGNGHTDVMYAERSNNIWPVFDQLWENNTAITVAGPNGKGLWNAADSTCSSCTNVIGRFNTLAHIGSGVLAQTSGFPLVKFYNNTIVDFNTSYLSSYAQTAATHDATSPNGSEFNSLFYLPEPIPSSLGWYIYNVYSGNVGFTAGYNMAACSTSPCSFLNRSGAGSFATDATGNQIVVGSPFVNYAANDFHLGTGVPAIGAGGPVTTVAAGDSGSGTSLVVNDAAFFQDSLGLSAVGVQADCISVGTAANHVCITAVNYTTNTLTLASSISRSAGEGVYLYSKSDGVQVLTGTAPDLGAYPYGDGGAPPVPPSNLSAVVN